MWVNVVLLTHISLILISFSPLSSSLFYPSYPLKAECCLGWSPKRVERKRRSRPIAVFVAVICLHLGQKNIWKIIQVPFHSFSVEIFFKTLLKTKQVFNSSSPFSHVFYLYSLHVFWHSLPPSSIISSQGVCPLFSYFTFFVLRSRVYIVQLYEHRTGARGASKRCYAMNYDEAETRVEWQERSNILVVVCLHW